MVSPELAQMVSPELAQSLGYVIDKNITYPVIVSNQYGRGKVILFSFDLLNCSNQQKIKDLIINSIRYVLPTEYNTRALGDTPISINIQNSTEIVDVKVTETIPLNTGADSINPPATQTENTIQWQLSLGFNENRKLGYWLLLPDLSGGYQTDTEVRYSNQGDYRLYGNYGLTVNVLNNSTELIQHIIADLQTLQVTGSDVTYVNNAIYNLNLINDYEGISKPEAQNNINYIMNALKELEKVSIDISTIRLKLDELLKIWQVKWNLAPEVVSQVERYRLVYYTDHPSFPQSVSLPSKAVIGGGNPRRLANSENPVLVASTGSLSGLLNSPASNEVLYFYHSDHLGTPIMMTDSSGSMIWEGERLPFGEQYSVKGKVTNNLGFPGQYYDAETGLHQNGFRDYKAEVGRYIEFDPILHPANGLPQCCGCSKVQNIPISSFEALLETPHTLNPFVYVQNRPAFLTDVTGLGPNTECIKYAEDCSEGNLYACIAYDACYLGNPIWGGANSAKNKCVRNCLLDKYRAGCKDPVCGGEHLECFKKCKDECIK